MGRFVKFVFNQRASFLNLYSRGIAIYWNIFCICLNHSLNSVDHRWISDISVKVRYPWVRILALSLYYGINLGKFPNFLEPRFPYLRCGANSHIPGCAKEQVKWYTWASVAVAASCDVWRVCYIVGTQKKHPLWESSESCGKSCTKQRS